MSMPHTDQALADAYALSGNGGGNGGGIVGEGLPVVSLTDEPEPSFFQWLIQSQTHWLELRVRILWAVLSLIGGWSLALWFAVPLMTVLKAINPIQISYVQLTPGEVLFVSIRVALIVGTVIASPVLLYQLLRFISPGLRPNERTFLVFVLLSGAVLFALGGYFAYALALPAALSSLLMYGQSVAVTQMSIAHYTDFCLMVLLLTGVLFELPLVLFGLVWFNLVSVERLTKEWRSVLIGIVALSALLTPSQDPLTLVFVTVALGVLYGMTLLILCLIKHPVKRPVKPLP